MAWRSGSEVPSRRLDDGVQEERQLLLWERRSRHCQGHRALQVLDRHSPILGKMRIDGVLGCALLS